TVTDADGDGVAEPGELLTYQIEVTNNGTADAINVMVSDPIPADTTYVPNSTRVNGQAVGDIGSGVIIPRIAANGGGAVVTFQVTVNDPIPSAVMMIANQATVDGRPSCGELTGCTPDCAATNSCPPTTIPTAKLLPVKTVTDADGDGLAEAGETLFYQIVITNNGLGDAIDVLVQDLAPSNTTYVVGSTEVNGVPAADIAGGATVPVITANGGSAIVTFRVVVDNPIPAGVQAIANQATIDGRLSCNGSDNCQPNCTDPATCNPTTIPTAGLQAVKTVVDGDGDGVAEPGEILTYQIVVTNNATADATNIMVQDNAPINTVYITGSTTLDGAPTTEIAGGVTIPTIPANGGTATVSFQARVVDPLPTDVNEIANQATVDGQPTCNGVTCPPDCGVTSECPPTTIPTAKSDYGDAPASYGSVRHTIGGPYLGVVVPDSEAAMQYSADASGDDANGTDDEDTVATLPTLTVADGSYTLTGECNASGATVAAWIDFDRSGTFDANERAEDICNSPVTLTWNLANNNAPVFTNGPGVTYARFRIASDPDGVAAPVGIANDGEVEDFMLNIEDVPILRATKSVLDANGNGIAEAGEVLTYRIQVTNNGAVDALDLAIADAIPAHTTYVDGSADKGGVFDGVTVTWTLPTVAANGGSVTVSFQVRVDDSIPESVTSIDNQAIVDGKPSCAEGESCPPDCETNDACPPTTIPVNPVVPILDLALRKTLAPDQSELIAKGGV
ncbi:MAG: DUF11 domain-containing protein, partial [Caldilineaceae bacterium]|nr:DUF11 domain-containing protein [Caldilineaceae bacterium]